MQEIAFCFMDILGTPAYGNYEYLFLLRIDLFLYLIFISSLGGRIPYFWMPQVEGTIVRLKGTLLYSFGSRMITMELSHHQIQCQQSTLFVFLCSYRVTRLKSCLKLLNIYWYITAYVFYLMYYIRKYVWVFLLRCVSVFLLANMRVCVFTPPGGIEVSD